MAKKKKTKAKIKKSSSSGSTSYKNTPAYNALTSDEKKLADLQYAVQNKTSQYTSGQLKDALNKAKKDSNGYMSQVLREFETTVSEQVAQETGDYQSHLDTINENIKEINEDLATNSANLTLSEQQNLAAQARSYEQTKGQLITQIANQGTTFSSIGDEQKSAAAAENKGIVESTTSTYNAKIADLQTQANRGNLQAQQQLKDLQRGHQQNINAIGQGAEAYLGTDESKKLNIPGYNPIGDISGQYKEDQVKDIASRQNTYLDNARQTSLNF